MAKIITPNTTLTIPILPFTRHVLKFGTIDGRVQAADIMVAGGAYQVYGVTGQTIAVSYDIDNTGLHITNSEATDLTVDIYDMLSLTQVFY